ncbi:unnamed protein product [Sphagnum compactum]
MNFEVQGIKVNISRAHRWKLRPHPKIKQGKKLMVIILDGWGEQIPDEYNAIHVAKTPVMDELKKTTPDRWRLLRAHGLSVGLPSDEDMGNSEVGHNALGAGRIFEQGAGLVDSALKTGKLYEGEGFKYIQQAFAKNTVHFVGLLSDGGVHSRANQLSALLKGCVNHGAKRLRVHVLLDGRDVAPGSGIKYVEALESELAELRKGGIDASIASGGGRMAVTMDRYENDWSIVKKGYDAQVKGEAPHKFSSCGEALQKLLEMDPKLNDQYFPPFVIIDSFGQPIGPIVDDDAVVTFNFRADRMVMAAKAFDSETFDKFDRGVLPKIKYVGMLQYDSDLKLPKKYLVSPPQIDKTSGEYLIHNNIKTFACSETVKFGHVTFVWNGNRSGQFSHSMEKYVQIPSDVGIAFNMKPEMKAIAIAEKARDALASGKWDQVRVNLANADMVGHTGDLKATVIGCEAVDQAVKIMLDAVEVVGGIFLITADHGNGEDMVKRNLKTGAPILDKGGQLQVLTSHTCNPVPIIIGGKGLQKGVRFRRDLPGAGLANVAATFINLHGFEAPWDYEPSLIEVLD